MSANFYNSSGRMFGIDLHDYQGIIPPEPVPVPGYALSNVNAKFDGSCKDEGNRLKNVTSDGHPTLQGGFTCTKIPHKPDLPIPLLPPHPLEAYTLLNIYLFSSSAAMLKKATVTGCGKPLAVCIRGAFGINLNCNDPVDALTGVVKNVNSVMTEPSAGDFASAWAASVVNAITGVLLGVFFDKGIGPLLPEQVRKWIEDKVKDKVNEIFEEQKDKHLKDVLSSLGVTHV